MKPINPKFDILLDTIAELGYCFTPYMSDSVSKECVGINSESNPYLILAEISAYMTSKYFYTDDINSVLDNINTFFGDVKIDNIRIFGHVIYFPNIIVE